MEKADGGLTRNERELTHMWEGQAVLLIRREKYNIIINNGSFLFFNRTCKRRFYKNAAQRKVRYFTY